MKSIIDGIRWVLRDDAILRQYVGVDEDGTVKVFQSVAKKNTEPPFVVFQPLPGSVLNGVYGIDDVWVELAMQFNTWADNPVEAWSISDVVHDALRLGDYSTGIYKFVKVRRDNVPEESQDQDSNLRLVASQYIFKFSK